MSKSVAARRSPRRRSIAWHRFAWLLRREALYTVATRQQPHLAGYGLQRWILQCSEREIQELFDFIKSGAGAPDFRRRRAEEL